MGAYLRGHFIEGALIKIDSEVTKKNERVFN